MKIESFLRAKDDIKTLFEQAPHLSYTRNDLIDIFDRYRLEWNIAAYRNYKHFLSFSKQMISYTRKS